MAQRVVFVIAEAQEQRRRQPGRAARIGLRLVAVGEDRVEDMRAKAGLGGMSARAMAIAKQRVQPPVALAAFGEVVGELDMAVAVAERACEIIEIERDAVPARQPAET